MIRIKNFFNIRKGNVAMITPRLNIKRDPTEKRRRRFPRRIEPPFRRLFHLPLRHHLITTADSGSREMLNALIAMSITRLGFTLQRGTFL
ncbi:hypothetical protein F511_04796 [Dorcoceras hygrometricum]|uniref:Uncharacterized protein n=1 Tax=Dorcoceras hygrometricum TaxID=472368 RepID=A0A2Z7AV60_9LAMI|nr:hypothetical protein F511_04796 [Dorcoceras hygrometricum]